MKGRSLGEQVAVTFNQHDINVYLTTSFDSIGALQKKIDGLRGITCQFKAHPESQSSLIVVLKEDLSSASGNVKVKNQARTLILRIAGM